MLYPLDMLPASQGYIPVHPVLAHSSTVETAFTIKGLSYFPFDKLAFSSNRTARTIKPADYYGSTGSSFIQIWG